MSRLLSFISFLFILLLSYSLQAQATVPSSRTFKYVNQGDFGEYATEYSANYRVLDISMFPFTLCFYNTTPNAFTLGLRMGHRRSESGMIWVWDANRGNPVRENATLNFGRDGNLVLVDVDGKVAWQTNTANKGVVGLNLLANGNLVLYDSKGKYVWQSFNYPTDTIFVGQTLRSSTGPAKIVSRTSAADGSPGPYSYGMEGRFLVMYYKTKTSQQPLMYYRSDEFSTKGALAYLDFEAEPDNVAPYAYELRFAFNMTGSQSSGTYILSRPKFNGTHSVLRVDFDGNLRIYTYDENVDWGAWDVPYVLFDRSGDYNHPSECNLPKKCGALGVCEDSQCVACPRPQGLLGWSKECTPPVLPPCKGGSASKYITYYKVVGVEHFTSAYNEGNGPTKLAQCKDKCDKDCNCKGVFYREEVSKCLVVDELGTLTKVSNSAHVAYIKMSA